MTFTLTPDQFAAKVALLKEQAGIDLPGSSGSVPVPGYSLVVEYIYVDPMLTVNVTGGNFLERFAADEKLKSWMAES